MTDNAQSTAGLSRRGFLTALTLAGAHTLIQPMSNAWAQDNKAPAVVTADSMRPSIPYGVASGVMSPLTQPSSGAVPTAHRA